MSCAHKLTTVMTFKGHSRSSEISQFDRAHLTSYYRSIVIIIIINSSCSFIINKRTWWWWWWWWWWSWQNAPILYRFPHIARYWSKIAKFIYLTCIQCRRMGWPRRNFAKVFKLVRWSYHTLKKLWRQAYIKPFNTIPQRDGRTNIIPTSTSCFSCADAR